MQDPNPRGGRDAIGHLFNDCVRLGTPLRVKLNCP